jgi:hypothetical protein
MGWPSIGGGGRSPTTSGGSCWGNPPKQKAPNPVQTGDSDTEAYYAPSNPSAPSFNIAEALLNASTSKYSDRHISVIWTLLFPLR